MTVGELIEKLMAFDPNLPAVRYAKGDMGGVEEIERVDPEIDQMLKRPISVLLT